MYEQKIIGYLLKHPNSKFVELCSIGLPLSVFEIGQVVEGLIESGKIKGRGFASHSEEYFVPDGGKFMSNENLGRLKDLGDSKL